MGRKFDPKNYQIVRTADGDVFMYWHKGGFIGPTNGGGDHGASGSYNPIGATVPPQWRVIPERFYKKIDQICSNSDVPIVFSPSYFIAITQIYKNYRRRNELAIEIEQFSNEKGLMAIIMKHIRKLQWNHIKDTLEPKEWHSRFPKYPVEHIVMRENATTR